jgi:hypothetical protein
MLRPTDDEIAVALCCGEKCAVGPNTGKCHRWDFDSEVARVRALLTRVRDGSKKKETNQV